MLLPARRLRNAHGARKKSQPIWRLSAATIKRSRNRQWSEASIANVQTTVNKARQIAQRFLAFRPDERIDGCCVAHGGSASRQGVPTSYRSNRPFNFSTSGALFCCRARSSAWDTVSIAWENLPASA